MIKLGYVLIIYSQSYSRKFNDMVYSQINFEQYCVITGQPIDDTFNNKESTSAVD